MQLLVAVFVYLFIATFVVWLRPAFLFGESGDLLKSPGLAQDGKESVLAAAVFFPLLALIVYYAVTWVSMTQLAA
jgi:hypothetical protein